MSGGNQNNQTKQDDAAAAAALAAAQKEAAEIVERAKAQAEGIVNDAKGAAAEIVKKADGGTAVPAAPALPDYYSGKVRGTFRATKMRLRDPYTGLEFHTDGDGVSYKRVNEIKRGSWLDVQIQAGLIEFQPEK